MKTKLVLPLIFSAALLTVPSIAFAGPHQGKMKQRGLDHKVSRMQENLGLSDEQADQVYDVLKNTRGQFDCGSKEKFSQRKACRAESRAAVKAELAKVLSAEQQAKMEQKMKERKEHWKGRGERRGRHSAKNIE